jgi:hypothetical protein
MQKPKLYLSQVIKEAKNACAGGYKELSARIKTANTAARGQTVDRRKLKDIVDGEDFTISVQELIALDHYLSLSGQGLADHPLFQKESVLQGLAVNEKIVFLLGAFRRDDEARNDVSLWDVKAFQAIFDGVQRLRTGIQGSLQDVFFLNDQGHHNQHPRGCDAILKEPRLSVCSIGSPKANVVTEMILAKMFHEKPFARSTRPVPFKFFWPGEEERKERKFASTFVMRPGEFEHKTTRRRMSKQCVGALVIKDEIYEVAPHHRGWWSDYGVVAVQKLTGQRVRLVIAGITGPTTYATALACGGMLNVAIPQSDEKKDSAVLWAVIRTQIRTKKPGIGDIRDIESIEVVRKPESWTKPE